ncbi:hypothetical protein JCM8202_002471 [Rhodotorula sphaerocarpa]
MGRPFNKSAAAGRGNSRGSWRGRGGRGRGGGRGGYGQPPGAGIKTATEGTKEEDRVEDAKMWDELDQNLGFPKFQEGPSRQGWLVNMKETLVPDELKGSGKAGVDYYFIQDDGGMFKATIAYEPYFYIATRSGQEGAVEEWLMRKYEDLITTVKRVRKEDLKLPNHLMGYRREYISLAFRNQNDLFTVRRDLLPLATKNREMLDAVDTYAEVVAGESSVDQLGAAAMEIDMEDAWGGGGGGASRGGFVNDAKDKQMNPQDAILDIREYDVPYYLRVAIDKNIRVGLWYEVSASAGEISFRLLQERVARAEPVVMAFDIETTKAPLKFPDQLTDQVMMISYMIDGQGFLITNREIVGADIEDFEYTPKPDYEGPFTIFNEADEAATILRFFEHFREAKPTVCATYNGDSFDFPFLLARATVHGIDMYKEIGFTKDSEDEFKSRSCVHMDCFRWVKRDSYLPQGSQGLKAVTVAKLGYNPIELDPELMTPYAAEQPQTLAQYSVSDAVATYYLYMKYVHPFVFSLCNIIPLMPDEVLRKGSGTLCETLLMVEAFQSNVIFPNRHVESHNSMHDGHLLESETYVGGHVEALEAGVFRSDIETDFKIVPSAIQGLIDDLDDALTFALAKEGSKPIPIEDVENYDEVKSQIVTMLEELRDRPLRQDTPLIYHLDVAAMYPNIMLSNRLQPDSVVTEADCAACDFNRPGKQCQRRMKWAWRGEYFPASLGEYKMIRNALEQEQFPPKWPGKPPRRFVDLAPSEQTSLLHKRLGDYSRKVYAKTKETKIETKEAIICQRENPFYIDTVRTFRDRRYTYKGLHKDWKKNLDKAAGGGSVPEIVEAKAMIVLYDSLQLAHKCILNSFYGYVMRKGARWHSMEMAGITCLTGASIIQMARKLVEQIGRPLELDTDGIWCMLPSTFPDGFAFKLKGGGKFPISYPCTMLNHIVHKDFTNDQYHEAGLDGRPVVREENSIFFELDGPYRAMILPSSKEEDKLLKKRYAVFNEDGSLAELKGFEVKRRGELQLIKTFQSQIFEKFLLGATLKDCYAAVASVADKWLDVLFTKAVSLPDDELVELIAENRSMSKTLDEYAGQKSTSISTARRLAEFLGEQMVKDKGLSCRFIISTKPVGAPVTERAVPVAIFSADLSVKRHFLRKWLKDSALEQFDLRSILDWDYYIERLGSVVQKLITIPAALQKIVNPVPRIRHPDWLLRRVANQDDKFKQHRVDEMFFLQKPAVREDRADGNEPDGAVVASPRQPSSGAVPPLPPPPKPDITRSYSAWIAHMKPIWREKRKELLAAAKAGGGFGKKSGALGFMMQQRSTFLSSSVWEVVQVTPIGDRPGDFKLWLLIADSLQSVRLRVSRQFLVNFVDLPEDEDAFPETCQVEAISRTLPRGQPALNLVRLTTPEDDYVRDEPQYGELLNGPNVDGVYEQQIPLLVRALLRLGSSCVPDASRGVTLNKGLDKHFTLDDLKAPEATLSKRRYLDRGRNLRYAYLYHVNDGKKGVFGLFLPNGAAKVYVVDRGKAREVQNLDKYYETELAGRREAEDERLRQDKSLKREAGAFEYSDRLTMVLAYAASEDVALRAITRDLRKFSETKSAPTMLVAHSPQSRAFFEERIPTTANFPLVVIPSSRAENVLPAIQWQAPACRTMIQHYLRASVWIRERVELADRFDVPVCNLERDVPLFLADLDFARRLHKADCVLWWSPSARPDLGGREADANASQLGDELNNPELDRPGSFSNACLEIEIRNLAVDAVLQSSLVYELEGGEGAGVEEGAQNLDDYARGSAGAPHVLGDAILPTSTFNMVRSMVKAWSVEAGKADGALWRLMLEHFWRWISSPASNLYDPALYRFVHGLMRKTFSQLLAEFRRLGSDIVHADFGRIFLVTNKPSSSTAFAYANYVVSSVTTRELFRYLRLDLVRFWDQLVWMDAANSAGIVCERPDLDEPPIDKQTVIELQFNIATYLPPAVQGSFASIIGLFVCEMLKAKRAQAADLRTPLRILQNGLETADRNAARADAKDGDDGSTDAAKALVAGKLTRELLRATSQLKEQWSNRVDPEAFQFPVLPGAHLRLKNPVLEFVKTTCAVLALARDCSEEVVVLKRNLLDLIGVREFAKEATFINPCLPFKVPMVVCRACNSIRDLDLCRNVTLLVKGQAWTCERCSTEYDRASIEALIIDALQRRMVSYQLQDLRCGKCRTMKSENLRSHCVCAGEYRMAETRQELARRVQVTSNVAEFHGLQTLASMLDWMREVLQW